MQLLLAVQDEEWDDIAATVKDFQAMTQASQVLPASGCDGRGRHVSGRRL